MNGRIIITVARDGATEIRTEGIVGNKCRQASQPIEQALGVKASEQLTEDYFRTSTAISNNVEQGEQD